MIGKMLLKKGVFAVLLILLVSVSGCGAIGSDSQITQMNQAFLPDATDEAEASSGEETASLTDDVSIVPEEENGQKDTFLSDNDSGDNAVASSNGDGKSDNVVTNGNENEKGDNAVTNGNGSKKDDNAVTNGNGSKKDDNVVTNGNASKKDDNAVTNGNESKKGDNAVASDGGDSKGASDSGANNHSSTASSGNGKNNNTNSGNNKNQSSKIQRNTEKPASTKKPVHTKKPQTTPMPVEQQRVCTISIDCRTILNNLDKLNSAKKSFVPENGIILPEISVKFQQGDTVFDILSRVCREREIHMEASYTPLYGTYYVEGIHQLYEFDCGKDMSGWKYFVNGVSPNYSCSKYEVKEGDTICWRYTCDGGRDLE